MLGHITIAVTLDTYSQVALAATSSTVATLGRHFLADLAKHIERLVSRGKSGIAAYLE
jgi:hypothetical protein